MANKKMSNSSKRIMIVAVFGLIIFAVTMMYFGRISKEEKVKNTLTKVVIASTFIPEGSITTAEMFEVKEVPTQYVVRGAIKDIAKVVNKVTAIAILPGEQLNKTKFKERSANLGLAYIIPKGKRAVSVKVDNTGTIAQLISIGDKVDVVCIIQEERTNRALTILQNVEVFALDQSVNKTKSEKSGGKAKAKAIKDQIVTFALELKDAEKLIAAADAGKIKLILRPVEDDSEGFSYGKTKWSLYPPRPKTQSLQIIKGTAVESVTVKQQSGGAFK